MYNLKYLYILTFLLFQFIGQTLGWGGSISSHSMSGNTIIFQLSSNTYWGYSSHPNMSCNTGYHIANIDGDTSIFNGCTVRISHRTVHIHFDPWITNIKKGSIIQFHSYVCGGCTYTVEKDLVWGIYVDMNLFGLIPYVNLDGPYFNITPKPIDHEGRAEFNASYDLGLPPGLSVQLYSPGWVASATKSVLHITVTLVQSNVKKTTVYKLGSNCKLEPAEGNKLFLYPGKDHPLEELLNYLEFNHTFQSQRISFNYEPVTTAHIQPIDHRLIFESMENGEKLVFNVTSEYSSDCNLNPTFTIEITKPDGCATEPASTLSGTIFTITNLCTPILYANPYTVKITTKLGPNTYEDTFVYFYSESHQSIDLESPMTQQRTGAITILFSEPINHTDDTIDDWPCDDFFFTPQIITKLGESCRMHRINKSKREIELILGKETTFKKDDIIPFKDSFCASCQIQLKKEIPSLSLTTSNTTLIWDIQNSHNITADLDPLNTGDEFDLFYWFYDPPTCALWQATSMTKENNKLIISNLCESSFPYLITIKRVTNRLFYREMIQSFITKEIPEQIIPALKYQESGKLIATFNKEINCPTPCGTPNEWDCNAWFKASSYEILGTGCRVKTFPDHPINPHDIEIYLGNDTQVGKGTIIYFIEDICPNCNLTLQIEQPEFTIQKFGLPLVQPNNPHELAGNVKDYCQFYNPTKLYSSDSKLVLDACIGVDFTFSIIPPVNKNTPSIQIIQSNDSYIQLNISDPKESDYFYKFILRMTLLNGFFREEEFIFYTQPMQEIAPDGIIIQEDGHFVLEFTQEFENSINNLGDVFTTETMNVIGSGTITSTTNNFGEENVLDITLGADTTLGIGDKILFRDSFCPGCFYSILQPIFTCTGLENDRWGIKVPHTITCSIQNLGRSNTRKFTYSDNSVSQECPMQFELSGTYNETVTIKANSLCINYPYKLKIQFDSSSFKKTSYYEFSMFNAQIEPTYGYSVSFFHDLTFPGDSNTVWDCDIYWFKPTTITKLGSGCTVTKMSNTKIEIQLGTNTIINKGDTIFFSNSFCLDCTFILISSPPSFTLTHDDLPYWSPEIDHNITAIIVDNTNGGNPQFTYTVTKPSECTQEVTLPQLSEVTISAVDLCASEDPYIVHVRMDIGNFHRELQFQFVTQNEQKVCPALCGECNIEGICQTCNSSKSHIKQINLGTECRCEDNYYYSSSAQNCQAFDKGASFDLGQSAEMITPDILRARYNYCSSLSPINQHYDEMINGIDILVITTTYSNLPTGIFNLLFTCRLKDMTSTSPFAFLDYDNCTLNETENGDYVVTFKISLDDIVNNDLCRFAQSTTGEKTIYLYICQIAQWFLATEAVPSADAAILKFNTRLKVSVDSKTMNKLFFSSNQIINIEGTDIIVNRDVNTTSVLCDGTCDGTNSGKSIVFAGENITAQINIEGVLANTYMMSLWSVEFKYSNGISSHMAGDDCTQITPLDIPGQMQITCIVTISDNNLFLEILIKLDPVEHRRRGLSKEKIELMESIIGSWTVCDGQDQECKKQMVETSKIIEEFLDEKDEDGEDKDKLNNYKIIIIGLAVGFFVAIIIIILVIIYFIRRLRRAKAEGKTPAEMKEEIQTKGIIINMETEKGLKEEGLPNQI